MLTPRALVVPLLALAACAGTGGARVEPAPRPGSVSNAELEALYRARLDSARMRFTDADVRFMTDMVGHHAQAVAMALLVPERAASPSIRTLGARIINAQQDEIALMQQWLADRGKPVPEVQVAGTTVTVHGAGEGHSHHMPGMLTPAQMTQLEKTRGPEFERLFLTYMIEHHRGAVAMVEDLLRTDGAAQDALVFKLASDIQVDQSTEVARMEQMLSAMTSSDAP